MTSKHIIGITAALALAATTGLANDQYHKKETQSQKDQDKPYMGATEQSRQDWQRGYGASGRSQQQQEQQRQQSQQSQQTISGEIDGFRHVDLRTATGKQDRHSLIRLRMEDGRSVIVDLGPKRNLDRLNLEQGDQVKLRGNYDTISGRSVFKADRLQINGRTLTVQRDTKQRSRQQQYGQTSQQQQAQKQYGQTRQQQRGKETVLTGTVEGFRHISVRGKQGQRSTHTLAKIELENGKTVAVNLGPRSRLDRYNIEKGERVRLRATQGKLNDQPMFLVDRISFTDRQQGRQQGRQQARQQQQQRGREQASTGQRVTIQGTVAGYQVISMGSGQNQRVLLNLNLEDGRSVLVDAGDYTPGELNLRNLDLQDKVTIQGRQTRHGNQQLLVADNIRFQSQPSRQQQGQSGRQQQQEQQQQRSQQQQQDDRSYSGYGSTP